MYFSDAMMTDWNEINKGLIISWYWESRYPELVETLDSNEIAEEKLTIKISFTTWMTLSLLLDPVV